jgi:transposase InsO family protein
MQWGLDQVGPLPKSSRGGHTYLLVTVDKFSKWIEAVPVTNQEATTAVKFFESIVYRYGISNNIITDNGTNFTSGEFQKFAKEFGIKIKYALVAHPSPTAKSKRPTGSSAVASRSDSFDPSNARQALGWRSYRRSYGVYEQRRTL